MNAPTPTKEITIADHLFSVLQPYAAGHVVTEAEAKALNQVRAENIRNNMAAKVKAAYGETAVKEGEPTAETIASYVAEYDANYQFTLASVGGGKRVTDPVELEALSIARDMFSDYVKAKNLGTVKSVRERIGDEAYQTRIAALAGLEDTIKEAKRRVKKRTESANSALAGLEDSLGLPAAEGDGAAEAQAAE